MKIFSFLLLSVLGFSSCNDAHIDHKIGLKKMGACGENNPQIHMESNVMGDRYTFNQCLPDNFTEKDYAINRKGDTLLVSFKKADERPQNDFNITLDIDAHPRYAFIAIGNQVLAIGEVAP